MSLFERPRIKLALAVLLYVAAVGVALARVGFLDNVRRLRLSAGWVMTDFYTAAYYPVQSLLHGRNPYNSDQFMALYPVTDPYPPYAPSNLLFHLPFGLVPPVLAASAYFVLTSLLTLALARLALRLADVTATTPRVFLLAGMILLSRPGHWTLLLGQVAILLTCGTYFALLHGRQFPARSGVGLFLTFLKPTFGVPLALLMWAWDRRRAMAFGVILAVLVNLPLVAILAAREGGLPRFLQLLLAGYTGWQALPGVGPESAHDRVDAASLISRFLGAPLSNSNQALLTVIILVAAAIVLRLLSRHATPASRNLAVGIICLATSIVGFHRVYDLVMLTAPFLAVAVRGLPETSGRLLRPIFLTLFSLIAVNWLATGAVLDAWQPSRMGWLIVSSVNGLCLAVLLLGYLWLGVRYHLRGPVPDTDSSLIFEPGTRVVT
jgi:glycosyl transferase family 87